MRTAQEPTGQLATIGIDAHSQGPKSTHVETAKAEFVVGREASPLDYLLGSLAACIDVIGHLVAKDRDVAIRAMDVHVEGDVDTRKFEGEASEPPAGFQSIRVTVSVDADADRATLEEWLATVPERCPVADNLRNASDLDVVVERA